MNKSLLQVIAEPKRFLIIEFLKRGPRPVKDIAEALHLQQPQASKHLRVLSDAGVVEVVPQAQKRIYGLQSKPFRELETWIGSYRKLWNGNARKQSPSLPSPATSGRRRNS